MSRDFPQNLDHCWHELVASGIPLEQPKFRRGITPANPATELFITQEGDECGNMIVISRDGHVGFILTVFIRRDGPRPYFIRDSWIEVPWHDRRVELLPDPADDGPRNSCYTLPGEGFQYPRKEILNHLLKGEIARHAVREGMLLAVDGVRPPSEYRDGANIPVAFNVVDQWDDIHSQSFELRLMKVFAEAKSSRNRVPLFGSDSGQEHPLSDPGIGAARSYSRGARTRVA